VPIRSPGDSNDAIALIDFDNKDRFTRFDIDPVYAALLLTILPGDEKRPSVR
jgi:hypothetical protein